jgi:hypothetical protein
MDLSQPVSKQLTIDDLTLEFPESLQPVGKTDEEKSSLKHEAMDALYYLLLKQVGKEYAVEEKGIPGSSVSEHRLTIDGKTAYIRRDNVKVLLTQIPAIWMMPSSITVFGEESLVEHVYSGLISLSKETDLGKVVREKQEQSQKAYADRFSSS